MPYRLFYDLWLEQKPSPGNSPSSADFEIGITFAYTPLNPIEFPIPVSTLTDEPIIINGQTETSKWNLYRTFFPGTSAPFYDFFLTSPSQEPSGTISIRLQDFIEDFGKYLSSLESYLINPIGPRSLSGYRLMGVELGTEFAGGAWELTQPSSIQLNWDWYLSSYFLSTNSSTINLITSQSQSVQTSTSVSCSPRAVAVGSSANSGAMVTVSIPRSTATFSSNSLSSYPFTMCAATCTTHYSDEAINLSGQRNETTV
jgi:hypothetical protein